MTFFQPNGIAPTKENGEPKFAVCIGGLGLVADSLLPIVPTIGMPDTGLMVTLRSA